MTTLIALLATLAFTSPTTDQTPQSLTDVCAAVGTGNIDALVAAMGTELELSIVDEEDVYDRATAAAALRKFYAGLGKTSFGKVHQGASKADDAEYCIGTLTTAKGGYRVYVYVAKRGSGIVLQELRFDPS